MELRTFSQRIDDLEADNNTLRTYLAAVQVDNSRLRHEFEQVSAKCEKLIAKVNEFVGRFSVVQ